MASVNDNRACPSLGTASTFWCNHVELSARPITVTINVKKRDRKIEGFRSSLATNNSSTITRGQKVLAERLAGFDFRRLPIAVHYSELPSVLDAADYTRITFLWPLLMFRP
jgi:hypothetical protein